MKSIFTPPCCRERFPLPDLRLVVEFERRLSITLPPVYRDFILTWNGGRFSECYIEYELLDAHDDRLVPHAGIGGLESLHGLAESSLFGSDNLASEDGRVVIDDCGSLLLIGSTIDGSRLFVSLDGDDIEAIYLRSYGEIYWICDSVDELVAVLRSGVKSYGKGM